MIYGGGVEPQEMALAYDVSNYSIEDAVKEHGQGQVLIPIPNGSWEGWKVLRQ
jgi:hypothetical protein